MWGPAMRVTGLDDDARSLVWWLVGRRQFFQLEFFEYTHPVPAPLVVGGGGSNDPHGWVRVGIAVPDFDRLTAGLSGFRITPLGDITGKDGSRRIAFREPFAGFVIEVCEAPGIAGPEMIYATQSVSDLAAALHLHTTVLGARIEPLEQLHSQADEAHWCPGVQRNGFLACYGEFVVEVLCYEVSGSVDRRPRKIYDNGIINLALGAREVVVAADLITRLQSEGHLLTELIENGEIVGTYFVSPGCEFEIFSLPEEFDSILGFRATGPFVANMGF